jgi:hypothetical protein
MQAVVLRPDRQRDSIAQSETRQDSLHVIGDRAARELESAGNLFVAQALGHMDRECVVENRPHLIVLEWSFAPPWAEALYGWFQVNDELARVPTLVCTDQLKGLEQAPEILRQRNDVLAEPFDIDALSARVRRL